ncbi:MAG TPA: hypothetical protein V6C97_16030, partial [Oculatellaceae cyanobacterium]
FIGDRGSVAEQQKSRSCEVFREWVATIKQVEILLLLGFLYAAILFTTKQQLPASAEPKKQPPPTPEVLMMSIGHIPVSNC